MGLSIPFVIAIQRRLHATLLIHGTTAVDDFIIPWKRLRPFRGDSSAQFLFTERRLGFACAGPEDEAAQAKFIWKQTSARPCSLPCACYNIQSRIVLFME